MALFISVVAREEEQVKSDRRGVVPDGCIISLEERQDPRTKLI